MGRTSGIGVSKNTPVGCRALLLAIPIAVLVAACDFWPRHLEPLAGSISAQVSGEATAILVSGDIVLIDVAHSPRYLDEPASLEALASGIARQAMAAVEVPLESIAVTFHEAEPSNNENRLRQFIFVVVDGRPTLQPDIDFAATGPLTASEIRHFVAGMSDALPPEQQDCVLGEMTRLANAAGDPEALDPSTAEYLSPKTWATLDRFGKRLILAQAMATEAAFACVGNNNSSKH